MTRAHEAVLDGQMPDRQSLEKGVGHRIDGWPVPEKATKTVL